MAIISEALQPPASPANQAPTIQVPETATQAEDLTVSNRNSIIATLSIAVGLGVLATISAQRVAATPTSTWVLWLAVAVGGLGGLAHEIAQSGGKILFFERKLDGFYIG